MDILDARNAIPCVTGESCSLLFRGSFGDGFTSLNGTDKYPDIFVSFDESVLMLS